MKICVIGAGTMGSGIAQAFLANEEYQVLLCDISIDFAEKGKSFIEKNLAKQVSKGKLSEEAMHSTLSRLSIGLVDDAADSDVVIEAVSENMAIKKPLFEKLDQICKPSTLLCSNTSSLSISEFSRGLSRPVVGMHFFNPAPVMELVEVTAGYITTEVQMEQAKALSRSIGKTPIEVNEAPGFVVNRLLIPMINEAIFTLMEGVASAEDIDTAMKLGANHPMGPLSLSDLIGNDIVLAIMEVLYNETGDSKYRPCPLLRKMVRAGKLGRKTKQGFFHYDR